MQEWRGQLLPRLGATLSHRNKQGQPRGEQESARDAKHAWSSCATSLATLRTKEEGRVPVPPAAATSLPHCPSAHSCLMATNYQECGGLPGLNQDQLFPSGQAPEPDRPKPHRIWASQGVN